MHNAITDVRGIEVGHADDQAALTGCTVVLCREGGVVGADVRGLAPGTRETDLCRPGTLVDRAHAILLTGGSAFGLNAAGGVMRFLWERDVGFQVGITKVPIVPGAVVFDLGLGQVAWPDEAMGYRACENATSGPVAEGSVGAGTGCSVGLLLGLPNATRGGVGTASAKVGRATVGALVVVNAFGDVVDPDKGGVIAGTRDPSTGEHLDTARALREGSITDLLAGTNSAIGVVATDATLNAEQVSHLANNAHDGMARAIRPVHTLYDGDTLFSLATGTVSGDWSRAIVALTTAAAQVVAAAIVNAVMRATPAGGLPSAAPTETDQRSHRE